MEKYTNAMYLQILLLFLAINSYGQVVFEKGYFIDNDDKKTECLIKNYDWKNSPTQIKYKLSDSGDTKTADISDITEFRVQNLKYQRFTVNIDQSGKIMSQLNYQKDPVFVEETVFLRLIIEGAASLYEFGKMKRYFYNVNNSKVVQLIHKEYISKNRITNNNAYKSQLWENLKCSCISIKDIEQMKFSKNDLVKIFEKYNTCVNSGFVNFEKKNNKNAFNLYVNSGLRLSKFSKRNSLNHAENLDYANELNYVLGLNAEFIFPFNMQKWAFVFKPTYQSYKTKDPRPYYTNTVEYQSIELPIGIKYNMFLTLNSNVFISGTVVIIDIPINSKIGSLTINPGSNMNFGFGFNYKNKYSIEINYGTRRELLTKYTFNTSNYQSISLIIGYNIF